MESTHKQLRSLLDSLTTRKDSLTLSRLQDEITANELHREEMENSLADARFDLQKTQSRCDRLELQLSDALEELKKRPNSQAPSVDKSPTEVETKVGMGEKGPMSTDEAEQIQSELVEQQALSESRLHEVEELSAVLQGCRKELEVLKVEKKIVSEADIRESSVFKALQLQYSVICQECQQLRGGVEDTRRLLNSARSHHFIQLEEIRYQELSVPMPSATVFPYTAIHTPMPSFCSC